MQNATRFLLDDSHAGVGQADVPSVFTLRQKFPRPVEADLVAAVRREMAPILGNVEAGQRIAVTGPSRGIESLATDMPFPLQAEQGLNRDMRRKEQ